MRDVVNVLHIIDSLHIGGAEKSMAIICRNLNRNKYRCIVCNLREETRLSKSYKEKGIDVISLNKGKYDITKFIDLCRIMKEKNIHIVHAHLQAAKILGILAAKVVGVPIIITHERSTNQFLLTFPFSLLFTFLYLFVDSVISISEHVNDYVKRKVIFSTEKFSTVYNTVDDSFFKLASKDDEENGMMIHELEEEKNNGSILIGYIGRIVSEKGLIFLVRAIPRIIEFEPNIKCIVVGSGKDEKRIKDEVEKLNIQKHVYLAGETLNVHNILRLLDIFVYPSVYEPLGIAILEAMMYKVPVVASRVGGIPEIISDGRNGILVRGKNSQDLARAIITLIGDPRLRKEYAERGFETIKEKFSVENMIMSIEDIYQGLLEKKRVTRA